MTAHLIKYTSIITGLLFVASMISCNIETKKEKHEKIGQSRSAVLNKKQMNRAKFKMEYPADWSIDSSDNDVDLDNHFILNVASGEGFVAFFIFNEPMEEKIFINEQVKANLEKSMKNGEVTYFSKWGSYKGSGAALNGKLQGVFEGEIKAFAHSGERCSFLIVSQLFDSNKQQDEPGLELIESSFKSAP